jgi:hypothetical protein
MCIICTEITECGRLHPITGMHISFPNLLSGFFIKFGIKNSTFIVFFGEFNFDFSHLGRVLTLHETTIHS